MVKKGLHDCLNALAIILDLRLTVYTALLYSNRSDKKRCLSSAGRRQLAVTPSLNNTCIQYMKGHTDSLHSNGGREQTYTTHSRS